MTLSTKQMESFSEQDTADKFILPYLKEIHGFPNPDSMDYQAQHTVPGEEKHSGRYDGLYLSGGYPYVILEAKKYTIDLKPEHFEQARQYATSTLFNIPVPYIVVSNGRQHQFYKKKTSIDSVDKKIEYCPIVETNWKQITSEPHGQLRQLLNAKQLLEELRSIKSRVYNDIKYLFFDSKTNKYKLNPQNLLDNYLEKIVQERRVYVNPVSDQQKQIEFAIQSIALHFTMKVLFIKIIEDLSTGADTPRIIHEIFPKDEYIYVGGIFGIKVLTGIQNFQDEKALKEKHPDDHLDLKKQAVLDRIEAIRLYNNSRDFFTNLGQDIAKVSYQDIFRYGFNLHTINYGKLFKAENYDQFLPKSETLEQIRKELIEIDVRHAIVYATLETRSNVIGDIYGRLIDDELRNSIGAIYTPEETVNFMVELGRKFLGKFRGKKIVEPACGSGHFYLKIYRDYIEEVIDDYNKLGQLPDYSMAHREALDHVLGRDIDPFAVQLTLFSVFLEQLKDNIKGGTIHESNIRDQWKADFSISCQDSLSSITINPDSELNLQPELLDSCNKALFPDLIIGNPPYGVKVVETSKLNDTYDLQSKDSYGYFIVNAIKRLPENKRVIFITSSSFLTIKTHLKLRQFILDNCKIIRIVKLHRSTFPGIDIFPVVVEFEKCSKKQDRDDNFYEFYDFWQLHPIDKKKELSKIYQEIVEDKFCGVSWPYDSKRIQRYVVRQELLDNYSARTIFDGMPTLFQFMNETQTPINEEIKILNCCGQENVVKFKDIRGVRLTRLGNIAVAKEGLVAPGTRIYYRIAEGGHRGSVKGGYLEVNPNLVLTLQEIGGLNPTEKKDGIKVDDPMHNKHFIPLDKPGASDIEGKILNQYYRPVEFYVDWSLKAVSEMKVSKRGRFQGSSHFFLKGITYSPIGLYSPTFRLGHGSVFDQNASGIFCDVFSREFLLGILCSKLIKYFLKVFINHSLGAQVDSIKEIPIAIPTKEQLEAIENKVIEIVEQQKKQLNYDYYKEQESLDKMVYSLYGLKDVEINEVENWYARRYPKLRRDIEVIDVEV